MDKMDFIMLNKHFFFKIQKLRVNFVQSILFSFCMQCAPSFKNGNINDFIMKILMKS